MSTDKQKQANRRNAQHSTGPRTPEGKAKSSVNARTHGLTSAQALAPSESADEFDAHASAFRDELAPTSHVEKCLVEQIIVAAWRLRRARIVERFILEQQATDVQADLKKYKVHYTDPADYLALAYRKECDGSNALDNLSRQETRIQRTFFRCLHELDHRRASKASSSPASAPAPQEDSTPILQIEPNSPVEHCDSTISEGPVNHCGAGCQPAAVALAAEPTPEIAESTPEAAESTPEIDEPTPETAEPTPDPLPAPIQAPPEPQPPSPPSKLP